MIVEGAGSPDEVDLRKGDIANMGFTRVANVPVVLVSDIDRGGIIASLVGTHIVLDSEDREMTKEYLINKFLYDPALFADGMTAIEKATDWKSLGILPWFADATISRSMRFLVLSMDIAHANRKTRGGRGILQFPC